jgi:DNA-binding LacI/PurR family transcriptional regulator
MKKFKVKDLAEQLQLSASTISLVLNDRPGIGQATRERVFERMRELGLADAIPRANRRRTGSLRLLLFRKSGGIVTDTPFFSQLIEGVTTRCQDAGLSLRITQWVGGAPPTADLSDCDGLVVLATELAAEDLAPFNALPVPYVLLDAGLEDVRRDLVVIHNVQGAHDATMHLVAQGHVRIGYLRSRVMIQNFRERFEGYRKALDESGLAFDPTLVFELDPIAETAAESFRLPDRSAMPTAFFADNDIIALGAMKALLAAGFRIPEDVSLVGFDDMPMCAMAHPALTTVRVPKQQLGRSAVDRLLARIDRPDDEFVRIEIGTRLVERDSVRPPSTLAGNPV